MIMVLFDGPGIDDWTNAQKIEFVNALEENFKEFNDAHVSIVEFGDNLLFAQVHLNLHKDR